jgi:hypothetical protein
LAAVVCDAGGGDKCPFLEHPGDYVNERFFFRRLPFVQRDVTIPQPVGSRVFFQLFQQKATSPVPVLAIS